MSSILNLKTAQLFVLMTALLFSTIGCSDSSTTAPTVPDEDGVPNPPSALNAEAYRGNSDMQSATSIVILKWSDNSQSETGFHIQRKTAGSGWIQLKTVDANVNYYRDTGIQTNLIYYYRVCAFNEYGRSGYSNEISVQLLDIVDQPRK